MRMFQDQATASPISLFQSPFTTTPLSPGDQNGRGTCRRHACALAAFTTEQRAHDDSWDSRGGGGGGDDRPSPHTHGCEANSPTCVPAGLSTRKHAKHTVPGAECFL